MPSPASFINVTADAGKEFKANIEYTIKVKDIGSNCEFSQKIKKEYKYNPTHIRLIKRPKCADCEEYEAWVYVMYPYFNISDEKYIGPSLVTATIKRGTNTYTQQFTNEDRVNVKGIDPKNNAVILEDKREGILVIKKSRFLEL